MSINEQVRAGSAQRTPKTKWGFTIGDKVEVNPSQVINLRGVVTGFDEF